MVKARGKVKISFVIPTYNESGNITTTLSNLSLRIKEEGWDAEILVVDDNSPDGTGKIVEELKNPIVRTIVRKKNPGFGLALNAGTKEARGEYVVWMMGDACDSLDTVPKMLDLLTGGSDLVVGSRYVEGGNRGDVPLMKGLCGSIYNAVGRMLYGLYIQDITNAFRAFRREITEDITLEAPDFSISAEMVFKASRKGAKIDGVPTVYKIRTVGESKFNLLRMGISYGHALIKNRVFG